MKACRREALRDDQSRPTLFIEFNPAMLESHT